MAPHSAGILLYRRTDAEAAPGLSGSSGSSGSASDAPAVEVLIVHPGGPFWKGRQEGAWSIPKGVIDPGEDPEMAARREFEEELGSPPPPGEAIDLGTVRQRAGKVVHAFALEGDLDVGTVVSTTIEVELRRGSGRTVLVPEIDEARWCRPEETRRLLVPAQAELVDRLLARLGSS